MYLLLWLRQSSLVPYELVPYASDYSRYLPENTSKLKIVLYAMLAGLIACVTVELIGAMVFISLGTVAINPIQALAQVTGGYSLLALGAIILSAIAANAINLYTNSLSAQIRYEKDKANTWGTTSMRDRLWACATRC